MCVSNHCISQDAKKEKDRLLQEIARDKELRKANKGVLPSVLGVDGYNPSVIQYDAAPKGSTSSSSASSLVDAKAAVGVPASVSSPALTVAAAEKAIDSAIQTISRYRTAGDGGQALKLLLTFVKNVNDAPEEQK